MTPSFREVAVDAATRAGVLLRAHLGGDREVSHKTTFITGELDPRWDNEILDELKTVAGSHFEVVDTGPISKP